MAPSDFHGLAEVGGLGRGAAAYVADVLGAAGELGDPVHLAPGHEFAKMVRVPGEAHGMRGRPSAYIAKIMHIQQWFADHRRGGADEGKPDKAE